MLNRSIHFDLLLVFDLGRTTQEPDRAVDVVQQRGFTAT